mmetsp:Transcript_18366/g.57914  ORF Transcript_18366/g.57914 Transcript_18366/m.57914 type:complete len:463 (+) Transcript_18366:1006-2394(+)
MPSLVIGNEALALRGHGIGSLGHAHGDAVDGVVHLGVGDLVLVAACGDDGGLVHEVGEGSAREANRALGDDPEVHVGRQGLALTVDSENSLAALLVGQVDGHAAVEAAGAKERVVEHVSTVGGGDDDDALVALEAVHLGEDLVERLLALVISAHALARARALAANGVDLVDENDAGRVLLRLLEKVAHAARAHAHEHLHELGARGGDERSARLASHSAREEGLTRSRGALHDDSAGSLSANGGELSGVLEELDDLGQLALGRIAARHVIEAHTRLRLELHLRLGLAHIKGVHATRATTATPRTTATHAAAREEGEAAEEEEGHDEGGEDGEQRIGLLGREHGEAYVVGAEQVDEIHGLSRQHAHLLAVALRVNGEERRAVGGEGDNVHLVLVHLVEEFAVRERAAALGGGGLARTAGHRECTSCGGRERRTPADGLIGRGHGKRTRASDMRTVQVRARGDGA